MKPGNLLTLWDQAITSDCIPEYPTYQLVRAAGGEPTFYIEGEVKISDSKSRVMVGERPANPDEHLRDPTLRFIADWSKNLVFRQKVYAQCESDEQARVVNLVLCKSSILYFANVWCWSDDPRLDAGKTKTPFVTFPFQDDILTWTVWVIKYRMIAPEEKSRDMGASWMAVIVAVWLALFYKSASSKFMSMKEDDVDDRTLDSLLGKVRYLVNSLPEWMRAGWQEDSPKVDKSMYLKFPDTGSLIKGILSKGTAGRSGRALICFSDEFAMVDDSKSVLDALSEVSNSKIFISTPNGAGNEFHRMTHEPGVMKKRLYWADHPLKNPEWWKLRNSQPDMDEERMAKEHEIAYETSTAGRVFPQFFSIPNEHTIWAHVQEGSHALYDEAYPVYSTTDLGTSDPCATLFAQLKPVPPEFGGSEAGETLVFFDEHQARDMTAFDLRFFLNSKPYRYRMHIGDMRTGNQRDSSGSTWVSNLANHNPKPTFSKFYRQMILPGPPIRLEGRRDYEAKTLETFRIRLNLVGGIVFSRKGCPGGIEAMQNWSFPLDRETRKPIKNSTPKHDAFSHYAKAILYLVQVLYGNLATGRHQGDSEWNFKSYKLNIR